MAKSQRVSFTGSSGAELSARLDLPDGPIAAFALFAHCFTCSKDFLAARKISAGLAARGFAVLRFDFTGLGASGGEFANTNFSSNVEDLLLAVDHLRQHYRAPAVMIGHSLGGAAVLTAAPDVPDLEAVAVVGAPAEAAHVAHNFLPQLDQINEEGEAEVDLAGRTFTIKRQFLEDIHAHEVTRQVQRLRKPLLVLHSPIDQTVGIENASVIFTAARHPRSFISLDRADHLLTNPDDAAYVADVIAAWAARYVDTEIAPLEEASAAHLTVRETLQGKFQNLATRGPHRLLIDEPASVGGQESGPSPYDYMAIALGGCTSMTLRIYANFKKLDIGRISVEVDHGKVEADHLRDSEQDAMGGKARRIDRFERRIRIDGGVTPEVEAKLLEIANKCPVHRTLTGDVDIVTSMEPADRVHSITKV